jgi:hypothetical protein
VERVCPCARIAVTPSTRRSRRLEERPTEPTGSEDEGGVCDHPADHVISSHGSGSAALAQLRVLSVDSASDAQR